MTELEERRAMRSIKDLLELGKRDPTEAAKLIDRLASSRYGYTMEASMYYALGAIRGALMASRSIYLLKKLEGTFASKLDVSVSDYLGDKRVHART